MSSRRNGFKKIEVAKGEGGERKDARGGGRETGSGAMASNVWKGTGDFNMGKNSNVTSATIMMAESINGMGGAAMGIANAKEARNGRASTINSRSKGKEATTREGITRSDAGEISDEGARSNARTTAKLATGRTEGTITSAKTGGTAGRSDVVTN